MPQITKEVPPQSRLQRFLVKYEKEKSGYWGHFLSLNMVREIAYHTKVTLLTVSKSVFKIFYQNYHRYISRTGNTIRVYCPQREDIILQKHVKGTSTRTYTGADIIEIIKYRAAGLPYTRIATLTQLGYGVVRRLCQKPNIRRDILKLREKLTNSGVDAEIIH